MADDNYSLHQLAIMKMIRDQIQPPAPSAPEGSVQSVADNYAKANKLKLEAPDASVKVKPNVSAKIAEAYQQMQHNPNDPKVQKAYQALINETEKQFGDIQKSGLKLDKITGANPYANSADLVNDITKNKHMSYFPTESGFGSAGEVLDHPMMKPTSTLGPDGKPMLANDLFRVVHDYFGHAKDGNKFGATGEEKAYLAHKQMYSPEAQKALATETRGQNSWVNYGPQGEANRANPAATTYADQKAGLMPDWATKHVDEIDSPLKYRAKAVGKMVGKAAIPGLAGLGVAMADTPEQAITDLVIPGGLAGVGEDRGEEAALIGERKGYVDYLNSQAAKDSGRTPPVMEGNFRSPAGVEENQALRQQAIRNLLKK